MTSSIKNSLLLCAAIFTLLWLGGSLYYITTQYGIAGITYLLPHEIGIVVLSLIVPIIFVWLFMFMGVRRDELREHTSELRKRLAELTFSGADANRKTMNLATILRDQTEQLRKATDDAGSALAQATARLQEQSSLLEDMMTRGLSQVRETSERLVEERNLLGNIDKELKGGEIALRGLMEERTRALGRAAEEISEKIVLVMDQSLNREGQLHDRLCEQVELLNQVSEQASEKIAEALEKQADNAANRANVALAQMLQSSRDMQTQLTEQAQKTLVETRSLTEGFVATLARLGEDLRNVTTETKSEYAALRQAVSLEQARVQETTKEMRAELLEVTNLVKEELGIISEDTSRTIDNMTLRVKNVLGEQAAIIEAAAETRGFGKEMQFFEESFSKMLADATHTARDMHASLVGQAEEYQKILDRLNIESQVIGSVFRVEANGLNEAAGRITGKAGELQDHIRVFIEKLEKDSEIARQGWLETRQQIEQQSSFLSKTSAQHILRVEEIKSTYNLHNEAANEAGEKAERRLEHIKSQLHDVIHLLDDEAGKAVHKSEHVAYLLSARAKEMDHVMQQSGEQFSKFTERLDDATAQMKEALQESSDKSHVTLDAFHEASENLTQVARKTAIHLGSIKLSAEEQIADLTHIASQMNEIADKLRDDMRDQTNQFTEAVKHLSRLARDEAGDTAGTLTKHAGQLSDAINRVAEGSQNISADMLEKIEEMSKAVEHAVERSSHIGEELRSHTALLTQTVEKAADTADGLGDKFRSQSLELAKNAETAFAKMEDLSRRQHSSSKDAFLRAAGSLVEELNALALDMHNLLDNEIPEKIWRRYRDGDRAIFARRLFRSKDEFVVPALQQRYEQDERFKDMVDRYVDKFEDLFGRAGIADPDSVLSATFITADIGKLYLVMAHSLGRKVIH